MPRQNETSLPGASSGVDDRYVFLPLTCRCTNCTIPCLSDDWERPRFQHGSSGAQHLRSLKRPFSQQRKNNQDGNSNLKQIVHLSDFAARMDHVSLLYIVPSTNDLSQITRCQLSWISFVGWRIDGARSTQVVNFRVGTYNICAGPHQIRKETTSSTFSSSTRTLVCWH